MDQLEKLYNLYLEVGILTQETTLEMFSQANEDQVSQLYELGTSSGLFETTDLDTFSSAWIEKKNDTVDPNTGLAPDPGGLESSKTEIPTQKAGRRNVPMPVMAPQGEKDTAIERVFGKNEVTDYFGDLYRAGVQGVSQGATLDDAFKLFSTGEDISDNDLTAYIGAVQEMSNNAPSEEMQSFSKIYEKEGKGVFGFLKGLVANPTVASQLFISSMASMLNPTSIAAGAAGAGVGAGAGAAATAYLGPGALFGAGAGAIGGAMGGMSGALETGVAYTEFLQEELGKKGLSFDKEGIRKILADEEAMDSIRNRSLGRGFTIGAIDALTAGLAGKATIGTATKLAKGAKSASRIARSGRSLAAIGAGGAVEAVGGSVGEIAARAVAGQEMDVAEIGFEGIAGTAGAPLTVLSQLIKKPSYKINEGAATRNDVLTLLRKGSDDNIANVKEEIINDPELKAEFEKRKIEIYQKATVRKNIEEVAPDISPKDLKEAIELQNAINNLESNKSNPANQKRELLNKKLKNITDKYIQDESIPESGTTGVPVQKSPGDSETLGARNDQPTELTQEEKSIQEKTFDKQAQENQDQVEETGQEERLRDNQISKEVEVFEVDMERPDGTNTIVEVKTQLDGSREVTMVVDGARSSVTVAKDNTLSNKEYVTNDYGKIVSSKSKPITEVMSQKKIDRMSARQKKAVGLETKEKGGFISFRERIPGPFLVGKSEVILNEDGTVKEIINKTTRKPVSKSTKAKIEKQLLATSLDVNEGVEADIPSGLNSQQVNEVIAEDSSNVRQVSEAIKEEQQRVNEQRSQKETAAEEEGLTELVGVKFTPESWEAMTGTRPIEDGISERSNSQWISKDGISIEDGWVDYIGAENYTMQDVIDFIKKYPNATKVKELTGGRERSDLNTLIALKEKFEKLTGIKATPSNVTEVLNVDPNQAPLDVIKEKDVSLKREGKDRDQKIPSKSKKVSAKKITEGSPKPKKVVVEDEGKALKQDLKKEEKVSKKAAAEGKRQQKIKTDKEKASKELNKRRKKAIQNITKAKLGGDSIGNVLALLFSVDSSLIQEADLKTYEALIDMVGSRKAILKLDAKILSEAEEIYNRISGNVESTIEKVKNPKDYNLESESKRIASIKVTAKRSLNDYARKLVKQINELTALDIQGLAIQLKDGTFDYSLIKKLELIKQNIEEGIVPGSAQNIMVVVNSNRKVDKLLKPFAPGNLTRIKILEGIRRSFFAVEKAMGSVAKNYLYNRVRNNPKFVIDEILGNLNSREIYNNTIRDLAVNYEKFNVDVREQTLKLDEAQALLRRDRSFTDRPHNKVVEAMYKIRLYQLQREHESNIVDGKENKLAPSAIDFLDVTVDKAIEGDILSLEDVKILQKLKKQFEVDGRISLQKIDKSFSTAEKKALVIIDEVNNSLSQKALDTSVYIRENRIDLLNNYNHHVILTDKQGMEDYYNSQKEKFFDKKVNTKAGPLEQRTPKAKPISFDPFLSATRAVQEVLLDYNMTTPIRTLQKTLKSLEEKIKNNPKNTDQDLMAVKALTAAINEANETVFESTFKEQTVAESFLNKVRTLGYQAALASAPRAVAEFASNFSFAMASNPGGFMNGVENYLGMIQNNELGIDFLNKVGSSETLKLYNPDQLTGKMADIDIFSRPNKGKGQAKSQLGNQMDYIAGFGGKQLASFVDKLANNVLSKPDQWISRPLYFGEFSKVFQQETGITLTNDDMVAIAKGDSKYLGDEYKLAIETAAVAADTQSIQMATSKNPYNSIAKLQTRSNDSARNAWRIANGYMANFSLFEFTTARAAVNALFVSGKISPQKAVGILAGVTMRMSLYAVLYQTIANQLDQAFGAEEEEEVSSAEQIKLMLERQLAGSISTLLTRGTLGNIPNIPITLGLESFNENYLQSLRDDEDFDPFKHAMVYSQLGKKDLAKGDLNNLIFKSFAGPYGPVLKSANRGYSLVTRSITNKTTKGRQKAIDELTNRMSYEALGNVGLLPFYKDIRRIIIKNEFPRSKFKKKNPGIMSKAELRKYNPRLYKKLYGPNSPQGKLDRKLRRLKK